MAIDGHRLVDPLDVSPIHPAQLPSAHRLAVAALVLSISSIVVGWVPFICALALAAAVLAFIFGLVALRRCRHGGDPSSRGLALAGVIIAPFGLAVSLLGIWLSVLTLREFDRFNDVGPLSFETTRCDISDGIVHFDGNLTNESDSTRSYHLTLHFLRPGTRNSLQSSTADIADVAAGESVVWSTTERTTESELDCKVGAITGPLPFADFRT